jgi:hypothetical protein
LTTPFIDPAAPGSAVEVPVVIEVLPIGTQVRCVCPRFLIAGQITGRISGRSDGGMHFPPPARHVALQVNHRVDCSAGRNHEHYNVGVRDEADGTQIYQCSICSLEPTYIEIAAEIRARSHARAAS